jgi:hypothetical protein
MNRLDLVPLIAFTVSALLLLHTTEVFGQSSPFSDSTAASGTQILPAIGAKATNGLTSDTGIVIGSIGVPGACPGSPVDLRDDGVIIQKISVSPPSGATLKLTQLTLTNLGSAPSTDSGTIAQTVNPPNTNNANLVIYDFNSKKCIAVATVDSVPTGTPFSTTISFSPAFDLTGTTIIGIAVQPAAAGNWSANMIGDTIQLRTQIAYQNIQNNIISNFSATVDSHGAFTFSLGTLSEMSLTPTDFVPINTSPLVLQNLQFVVNAANEGHLHLPSDQQYYGMALRDVCVLNVGSAHAARDINSITLFSAGTAPATSLSGTGTDLDQETKCAGAGTTAFGTFNSSGGLGVSLQTPPMSINSIILASSLTTNFTLTAQLRSSAGLGQTLRLQTALILAPIVQKGGVQTPSGTTGTLPGGANPRAMMSETLAIESGQPHLSVSDAEVIPRSPGQDFPPTTETTLDASNFSPLTSSGGGVQSFSATLSYDPMIVQIAGASCLGIRGVAQTESSGVFHRTQISNCQVDNGRGAASFLVQVVRGTLPTGGPAHLATIALQAGVQANASSSTLLNLAVSNVRDKNGNLIGVTATPALVRFLPPGDVNGDGQVTSEDAVLLANAILAAMAAGCGNDAFAAPISVGTQPAALTVPQLEAADIAFPFATPQANPPIFAHSDFTCANITSADVAAIARLALLTGRASAVSALQTLTPSPPWNTFHIESLALTPVMPRSGGVAELSVHGYGITGLELWFYDLAGRLVFNEFADGSRLRFQLADGLGRPLARGVYLYVVTMHGFDGTVIQSGVRKLIVR